MLVDVRYPEVVLSIKDVKAAIDAGDRAGTILERALEELDNNITIKTSEESGIAHREQILGIQSSDTASIEDRRLEVLLRWYDMPIYSEPYLRQKLDNALGAGNYVLTIDLDGKIVKCGIELTRRLMFQSVRNLLEQMVPLDYLLDVVLRYNQYITLEKFTYAQLSTKTFFQLRNEVIDFGNNA